MMVSSEEEQRAEDDERGGQGIDERRRKRGWFIAAAWAAFILASVAFPGSPVDGIVFCPFRAITSHSCPGCGMTRACTSLVRGDLASSLEYHPLGWLLVSWFTAAALTRLLENLRGRRLELPFVSRLRPYRQSFLLGVLLFALLFGGLRLVLEIAGILTPV